MPISFTDKFKIDKEIFKETGAFDIILDIDSRLFVDPALLELCDIQEFKGAKEKVEKYFSGIITLLSHSQNREDMYWKQADRMLTFKELTGTCFGYSRSGTDGNSIGTVLRKNILCTIKELIEVGEKDPSLLELLGVFQEGIGCDRISDLLTFILAPEMLMFTQRIMEQLNLANSEIVYKKEKYKTIKNEYNHKPIILVPFSFLSPLPVADDFGDIDQICMENERVRQEINARFDLQRRKKLTKGEIYLLMKSDAEFRKALFTAYNSINRTAYDFEKDPIGEYSWYQVAKDFAKKYPLELDLPQNATTADVLKVVEKICEHFKSLVEDNGLWNLLYNDNNIPKHERAAQLLFFGIADAYCKTNSIDLSREVNNGRGSVDFKLSCGACEKVLVEIKLTSNGQLLHGFEVQLPIYMKQESTSKAIYLIIDNGHKKALEGFVKYFDLQTQAVKEKIQYRIIYGMRPKSASQA